MQAYKLRNSEGGILCLKKNGRQKVSLGTVKDEAGEDGGQGPSHKIPVRLGELASLRVFMQASDAAWRCPF